jgi:hypothetical protein
MVRFIFILEQFISNFYKITIIIFEIKPFFAVCSIAVSFDLQRGFDIAARHAQNPEITVDHQDADAQPG